MSENVDVAGFPREQPATTWMTPARTCSPSSPCRTRCGQIWSDTPRNG